MRTSITHLAEKCLRCKEVILDHFVYVEGASYMCDACYEKL